MELHLSAAQQTHLAQMADRAGTDPEQLATTVVVGYLEYESRYLAAVKEGLAAAERGDLLEEEEMDARLEAMFKA